MALQASGNPISLGDIQTEFGGSNGASLSEYYRSNYNLPLDTMLTTANNTNVPVNEAVNPELSLSDFYQGEKYIRVDYEMIPGGGGGAGSVGGTGGNGGSSGIDTGLNTFYGRDSGTGGTSFTFGGGAGGSPNLYSISQDGEDSYYGAGGEGGINHATLDTDGNAPSATAYGAGGGSAGTQNGANTGGDGGSARSRRTGAIYCKPSTDLDATVGAGGTGGVGTRRDGGAGAGGYVKLTINGTDTEYTTPGTHTITIPAT